MREQLHGKRPARRGVFVMPRHREIAAYTHPAPKSAQVPDTKPGPYYVSTVNGSKFALVSGPYATHAEALADVSRCNTLVCMYDGRAHFFQFGTVRCKRNTPKKFTAFLQKCGYPIVNGKLGDKDVATT